MTFEEFAVEYIFIRCATHSGVNAEIAAHEAADAWLLLHPDEDKEKEEAA